MSTSVRASSALQGRGEVIAPMGPLLAILGLGLLLRVLFIGASGFHNDVAAFESWALILTEHPLDQFYATASFADYPPGYFYVLLVIGWLFKGLVALHLVAPDNYGLLAKLVKLPAIAMDLVDAWLLYRIARRFASTTVALGVAALLALNPAAIYISAYWGQVDSVSWGLVLLAIDLLLSSRGDAERGMPKVAAAWVVFAISILMKPQGAFVAFVFIAFAFVAGASDERRRRLTGTAIGMALGLVVAWLSAAIFHATLNPISDFSWLFGRYAYASSVYPYTSINAFNLWAIRDVFWQPDTDAQTIFGLALGPRVIWGWVLVASATALITARYVQRKDDAAFLEAAMLVSFAFFIFATRMHERYSFGAFLLMMPLVAVGRRYVWPALVLSVTLIANLVYSLHYQTVMEDKLPGLDATNLWPFWSHALSFVNVGLFFALGALYLGTTESAAPFRAAVGDRMISTYLRARAWFDPGEGVAAMTGRDWIIAVGMTLASFVICILWYQYPAEKYFDEVYYPRAGEEYLQHKEIFEYTHPPLTKLIVTLSMLMFGGLNGLGDTGFGWRFLNIVIGALTVGVLYVFAKHLTRSTIFASLAGGMLLFDGFHYVQSRIATPEITVAFFSLTTLYAFYRFWIASQVRVRPLVRQAYYVALAAVLVVGAGAALGLAWLLVNAGQTTHDDYRVISLVVAFLYFFTIPYLVARTLLPRFFRGDADEVSYAEGTRLEIAGKAVMGETLDGFPFATKPLRDGAVTRTFERDGRLTYATPEGSAAYAPDGSFSVAGLRVDPNDARFWLIVLAISGGALAASKWNGLFDFFVVWGLSALVVAQRWLRRPAVYGNPFGIPLDVVIGSMFVAGGAIYTACYIPFFTLGHNFVDMVGLQHDMYWYHSTLVATHPYASKWWQWPIIGKPISYYYHDFRAAAQMQDPTACCVAEILALPNPFVWWLGLVSIPFVAVLAWTERNKGYALLVVAYFLQWLPWIGSPRIAFEYHFYPNLAMIVLANAVLFQKAWQWAVAHDYAIPARNAIVAYAAIVAIAFVFFFPILAGTHVSYDQWHARIWFPSWII